MIATRDEDGSARRFLFLCAVLVLVASAPAIIQFIRTGGYLYYRNGADEGYYLQYGASLHTQGMSRAGQYLVSALHCVGLSGGYVNALLDATLPLAVLLLVRAIGLALGLRARAASACAFLVVLGPVVFLAGNPLVAALFRYCAAHGWLRYIAVPDGVFLPILRSPEPQFSWLLLCAAAWLALRRRSFVPVYAVLPFLYPLIALPAAFVTIGLTIRSLLSGWSRHPAVAIVAAWGITSIGAGVMLRVAVAPAIREALVPSHVPLASLTSMAALCGWLGVRRRLDPEWRARALLVALAPLAGDNIHVITGWLVAPVEVEMYAGSACAALLCGGALFAQVADSVLAARRWRVAGWLAAAAVTVSAVRVASANVAEVLAAPLIDEPVLEALRADAGRVVWSDGQRSRVLALVLPRQAPLALDFGQTWPQSEPDKHLDRYLAVRGAILDGPRGPAFARVLAALDAGYAHSNEEDLFFISGRKRPIFAVNRDVSAEAARRRARATDLIYVVERPPGRLLIDR